MGTAEGSHAAVSRDEGRKPGHQTRGGGHPFYAGWLGHYVGDGAQPLHVTVQYNGWTGPNPNGYTTAHQIHSQFEGAFVAANIHAPEVEARMTPAKAIDGDL